MPSIDERVVSIAFENQVFEQRVATTMSTLNKLDSAVKNVGGTSGLSNIEKEANKVTLQGPMSALDKLRAKLSRSGQGASEGLGQIDKAGNKVTLEGPSRAVDKLQGKMGQLSAGKTFTDIERASDRVELSGLTRALDNVQAKFSVLEGAASVALGNIASKAAMKGAAFAKSFAFGPLQQGFGEYQTNLQSIQTILANTQGQQVTGLDNTQKYLGQLNTYSDKTIYNFGEMAKNIGTFTAAGVDLPKSVESIKGIANLAALSGSNSQQASTAMYQLSQAIASGRVGLQDWNSVVNAGMGGAVFQKSLMRTAENMGALKKGAVDIDKATGKATVNGKSFRESIMAKPGEQSWLTSDVLTKTLGQFTGDLKASDLAAQGFSKSQIKAIQAQAKSAQEAATQVKTLPQVFDIARETIGSGWSKTFSLIFGDFEESKKTFTEFSNFINGFITKVSNARNKVLGEWKKLGGRTELIEGIKDAFHALMGIILPIKDAFREIFPAQTGKDLFEFTKNFHELMSSLIPAPSTMNNLSRIFAGLFAVVHIGWTVIKEFVGVIFDLLGVAGKGAGGFLGFVAGIGDFLKSVDIALTKGGLLHGLFQGIAAVLKIPLRLLGLVAQAIGNLFGVGESDKAKEFEGAIGGVNDKLGPLKQIVETLSHVWDAMTGAIGKAKKALEPWFSQVVDQVTNFGKLLVDAIRNLNFDDVMKVIQTGLVAGLLVTLKKALGDKGIIGSLTGAMGNISKVMSGLTGNLEAMQKKVNAQTILTIAAAILVLAGGIYILSTIDADKLAKAMSAVAIGLGELMGAMKLMMGGMGKLGILQLPIIAGSMIALALAVTILAGAMKIFATMSWEDIAKGLIGVAGSISAVGLSMRLMPPTLPLTAAGLILIAIALNIMAAAMAAFASMSWEELGKGLLGVVEALGGIALGVSMMPPTLPITAAGLILMGIALASIGGAIRSMGSLDLGTIVKGLGTIMAALAGIGLAMSLVPPTIALTAAGIFIVASAMVVLSGAMRILGGMSLGEIIKSLIAMGGALLVLGTGLIFMSGTLAGSAALLAASVALALLAPTLVILGNLSWGTIIKGLAAIALTLGVLSVVGLVASAGLVQLGIALLPLAAVFVVAAAGVFLFAKAMQLLGAEGGKGVAVMVAALTAFVAAIPTIVIQLLKGLLSVVEEVVKLAPRVIEALGKILEMIITFVVQNAPKLAVAINALIAAVLNVLVTNIPKIIEAGSKIIFALLSGISKNIGQITAKAAEIITKFLNTLTAKAPGLSAAGARTLIAFINGITANIPRVVATVANMVIKFINALSTNVPKIINAAQNMMIRFIGAIANFVPKLVSKGAEIILKFLDGIGKNINRIVSKGADLIIKLIEGITQNINKIADKGADAVIKFLHGLATTIRTKGPELIHAGFDIADALIDGLTEGFGIKGPLLKKALDKVLGLLPGWARKILGISSPSRVFAGIGANTMLGLQQGMVTSQGPVYSSARQIGMNLIGTFKGILGIASPSKVMREIGKEVGHGFKDGLDGSAEDIGNAFTSLREKITQEMSTIRGDIKTEKDELKQQISDRRGLVADLRKEEGRKKPDTARIKELRSQIKDLDKDIFANQRSISRLTSQYGELSRVRKFVGKDLADERKHLQSLSKQYEAVTAKLQAAEQTLGDAIKRRDDAAKAFTDKYSDLPGIDKESKTSLEDYKKQLQDRIIAVKQYHQTLQALRAAGIDDTTYQMLLEQGTAGQEFANQLLAGGKVVITEINTLDTSLKSAASTLGTSAARNLYQAGVNAAQGLVNGLRQQKSNLYKVMTDLALSIVRALKRKLKIRSPSEVFAEVGAQTVDGLASGLSDSRPATIAATKLGTDTMGALSSAISDNIDVDPTITPVLDLSQVQKEAPKLDDLTNVTPIRPLGGRSVQFAASISDEQRAREATTERAATGGGAMIHYTQNNYSPDPLSNIEIYRQTNNQLSQLKKSVGV